MEFIVCLVNFYYGLYNLASTFDATGHPSSNARQTGRTVLYKFTEIAPPIAFEILGTNLKLSSNLTLPDLNM